MFDRLCPVTRSIRQSLAVELNGEGNGCVALRRYQPRRHDDEKSVSSVQDWGQEVEEDAVYSVAMKKIQIKQASHKGHRWLGVESDPRAPGHGGVNRYETCRVRSIRAGTLAKLVENLLLSFGDDDSIYISVFLATFRAFSTAGDVLRLLLDEHGERKNGDYDDGHNAVKSADQTFIRKAVAFILRVWMDQYPEDFHADPEASALVLAYVSRALPGSELQRRARCLLSQPDSPGSAPAPAPAAAAAAAQQTHAPGESPSSTGEDEVDSRGVAGGADAAEEKPDLLAFPAHAVAQQLTYRDAELFKKVAPHHCLGCVWSRRGRKENLHLAPSVRATIAQFNAVAACVVCTVLRCAGAHAPHPAGHGAPGTGARHAAAQRARVIEHWVGVAQECRMLKNFSSLRAILSALQTNPIHRLKKTWCCVSREKIVLFAELSEIFSDENNHLTSRELLMKEGTSKFAILDSNGKENQKRVFKRPQTPKEPGLMQGTIPYLGTFLTDLTMLDTALPDHVEGGLINFEKRRKEFEVIAQIRLLQLACNNYSLSPEGKFLDWFSQQEKLSDEESYALSCEIEPPTEVSPTSPRQRKSVVKRLSLLFIGVDVTPGSPQARTPNGGEVAALGESPEGGAAGGAGAAGGESCGASARPGDAAANCGAGGGGGGERADCLSVASSASEVDDAGTPSDAPDGCHKELSTSSSLASLHSADVSSGVFAGSGVSCSSSSSSSSASSPRSSFRLHSQRSAFNKTHQRSVSCCSAVARPVYNRQSDDSCIIRVVLQSPSDGNLYKSVLLTSQDKTSSVIGKAMVKYNLETERAEDYQLVQVISSERELVMPDRANVFYAMSTSANFDFVLRKKGSPQSASPAAAAAAAAAAAPPPPPSRSQSSSSLPNLKSKGSLTQRLNRAAL